jgi:hypothetical protein
LAWRGFVARDALGDDPLEIRERLVRERVDVPGLQVAPGCCALGAHDQFAHDVEVDRLVEKSAASDARVYRREDIHDSPNAIARCIFAYTHHAS